MSLTKKPLTAIHYFTLQIIGGILVVVGIVSLSRGEKSILGLGILVGLFVLIAPGILKNHRIPRVSEARSVDRGRGRRQVIPARRIFEQWRIDPAALTPTGFSHSLPEPIASASSEATKTV